MKALIGTAVLLLLAPFGTAQKREGSIYNPDAGPSNMIAAKTAYRRGDILTVIISEQQNVTREEASDMTRATNLNYKINLFDIKPNTFNPLPRLDADSTEGFIGAANYAKAGQFSARLAAIIIDTLPNGNLVISGRREIRVDHETKIIEFSGVVRRYDIQPDNTVESELVANAQVKYEGRGPMTDSTNRYGLGGRLHRFFAWIWPF